MCGRGAGHYRPITKVDRGGGHAAIGIGRTSRRRGDCERCQAGCRVYRKRCHGRLVSYVAEPELSRLWVSTLLMLEGPRLPLVCALNVFEALVLFEVSAVNVVVGLMISVCEYPHRAPATSSIAVRKFLRTTASGD